MLDNDPEVLHDGNRQIYVLGWLVKGVEGFLCFPFYL